MIKRRLSNDVDKINFFSERIIHLINKTVSILPFLKKETLIGKQLEEITNIFRILSGTPTDFGLNLAYSQQKNRFPPLHKLNPSKDNIGIKWEL